MSGRMDVVYRPLGTKFWFIWSGRIIRVKYGHDVLPVVVLAAPRDLPARPPFAPGISAFVAACEIWLAGEVAVAEVTAKAL